MADVRLDQENVLSDYDYLLAVKGNDVVRISKKDQATVAGELIVKRKVLYYGLNIGSKERCIIALPSVYSRLTISSSFLYDMVTIEVKPKGIVFLVNSTEFEKWLVFEYSSTRKELAIINNHSGSCDLKIFAEEA